MRAGAREQAKEIDANRHIPAPLHRVADPLLGIATGVFAYYLYETDPKNAAARPAGRSLLDVGSRWWNSQAPARTLYVGPKPLEDQVERTGAKVV